MVADLKQRVLPAREMRFVTLGAGGVMEVKVV
jgi:hypothetical protein